MLSVENRDNFIGWDEKERLRGLKHLAVVSTCVSSQPLGFNFLGGKLLAALCTTETIRDLWKEKYGDTLIGLTTTSLFGQFSQYNSILFQMPMMLKLQQAYDWMDFEVSMIPRFTLKMLLRWVLRGNGGKKSAGDKGYSVCLWAIENHGSTVDWVPFPLFYVEKPIFISWHPCW